MNKQVKLSVRYEDGRVFEFLCTQGTIPTKPAYWAITETEFDKEGKVKDLSTVHETSGVRVSDALRREIAQYFGINYQK